MDVVEIVLFYVVALSVLVFLVLDTVDSIMKAVKAHHQHEAEGQSRVVSAVSLSSLRENYFPEVERQRVGARDVAEAQLAADGAIVAAQDIGEEETEKPDHEKPEKSNLLYDGEQEEEEGKGDEWFDDWESIERTELEKAFGEAVAFVGCKQNPGQIGDDLTKELYGLRKVALEGACHGSRPMALKVSVRSKWNAWHRQGNMSPESAMEKYVHVLSDAIPWWRRH